MEQDSAIRGPAAQRPASGGLPARQGGAAPAARNDDQEVRDALMLALHKVSDFVRARPAVALGATALFAYFYGRSRPNGPPPPRRGLF